MKKIKIIKKNKKDNYIINNYYIEKINKNIIDSRYLVIPIPEKIQDKKIKTIEIIPIYNTYKIVYNYENENKEKEKLINIKLEEIISIDLGVTNFLSIYNPTGNQNIIKGGLLKSINYYISKKIGDNQKKNKLENIKKLTKKREDIITNFYNKIVSWIKKEYSTKKLIIIGYNELWKQNTNLGKKNNLIFNKIPYLKLIRKLKLHFNIITTEESYTSKCDGLNLEKIGKKEKYDGERINRGLYSSAKRKLINADINGAINIMRKQINLEKVVGNNLYNPKVINVFRE
jgi:IS605 OrfB family transposase